MRRIQNGKPITNYKYNFVFGHLKGKHTHRERYIEISKLALHVVCVCVDPRGRRIISIKQITNHQSPW